MSTGRAGPRWGCVASGEEWENSLLESVNRGWVKGGGLAYPVSSSNSWSTLDPPAPPPRASLLARRGAPEPRVPRLTQRSCQGSPGGFWKRLPASTGARGQGRRETSPTCWRASLRPPLRAGCACARGCEYVCACVCARWAGGRGPPSVSSCLRPEMPPPPALAGGSQVAAGPDAHRATSIDLHAPLTPRETTVRITSNGGSRSRSQAGAPRSGAERTAPHSLVRPPP